MQMIFIWISRTQEIRKLWYQRNFLHNLLREADFFLPSTELRIVRVISGVLFLIQVGDQIYAYKQRTH